MRYFGVEEANRLVPLLKSTFEQVHTWAARAQAITRELESLGGRHDALTETRREEREVLIQRIREALNPLEEMGLEIKGTEGLVDFRARLAGRSVYLCWRFGEPAVAHWHELDTGFAGRRPIEDAEDFAPSYLS